jgi:inward rectifier potassium channel
MKRKPFATVQTGNVRYTQLNIATREWRDLYHWILTLTWPGFAALVLGGYLSLNFIFAALYFSDSSCIADMKAGSFSDAFFFSVETLATVGYGHMYPATFFGHVVSTLEIMVGMFGMAVTTGVIFVRFSRPSARFEYSRCMVLSAFNGKSALMFRVANLRHQAMAEAEFRLMLIRKEKVREEAKPVRRFYSLPLQFDRAILFPAALTLRHIIDEESPLHGASAEDLQANDSRFLVSVVCIDTVIPSPIQSQNGYTAREVLFGRRFVEISREVDSETVEIDYARISDTEPAASLEEE